MAETFPILVNETDTQVQEVQRIPNKMKPKRLIGRHKMSEVKNKERILKAIGEGHLGGSVG